MRDDGLGILRPALTRSAEKHDQSVLVTAPAFPLAATSSDRWHAADPSRRVLTPVLRATRNPNPRVLTSRVAGGDPVLPADLDPQPAIANLRQMLASLGGLSSGFTLACREIGFRLKPFKDEHRYRRHSSWGDWIAAHFHDLGLTLHTADNYIALTKLSEAQVADLKATAGYELVGVASPRKPDSPRTLLRRAARLLEQAAAALAARQSASFSRGPISFEDQESALECRTKVFSSVEKILATIQQRLPGETFKPEGQP